MFSLVYGEKDNKLWKANGSSIATYIFFIEHLLRQYKLSSDESRFLKNIVHCMREKSIDDIKEMFAAFPTTVVPTGR